MLDVMKIHGSLCHISFVFPDGRSHLPSLSNFVASYEGNDFLRRYPPHAVIADLKWWAEKLSVMGLFRSLTPRDQSFELGLYVDASTNWGIGVIWGGRWDAWKLQSGWKSKQRHIGWLEGLALELLIYMMEEQGLHNVHVLVHSDNQGVIGAFDKGRSRNFEVNLSIRRSACVLATRNISLKLEYAPSKSNPSDPISRGILGLSDTRLHSRFTLPRELVNHICHV